MSYEIFFSDTSSKDLAKYKKSNPITYKKLIRLLHELTTHPRSGTGHPEPLKNGNMQTYSRRVTAHDRLIYDIDEVTTTIVVLAISGHYNDK